MHYLCHDVQLPIINLLFSHHEAVVYGWQNIQFFEPALWDLHICIQGRHQIRTLGLMTSPEIISKMVLAQSWGLKWLSRIRPEQFFHGVESCPLVRGFSPFNYVAE